MNRVFLTLVAAVSAMAVHAQSSVNTYSPFTFYGLGDIQAQGSAAQRGMGGVAVANRGMVNYVNPASLSALPRNAFQFNFGIEGDFFYLKEGIKKTSYNTFNIRDLAFRMPLGRKIGFGVSLSPYSSVGYRVKRAETDPEKIVALYGAGATGVDYIYKGSGDVSQAKLSLGWEPLKRLSVGAEMIYYFGKTERSFVTDIVTRTSSDAYFPSAEITQADKVSRIRWGFGAQYNIIERTGGATAKSYKVLTIGATYLPAGLLNPVSTLLATNATSTPQPLTNALGRGLKLPDTYAAGLYYRTWKLGAGADYERQNWAAANADTDEVGFRNTNSFRAGVEYTPSRYDVRNVFRRITYRVGLRRSDYYMRLGGRNIGEQAVTAGFGIPFKTDRESYIDLGFEYGSRGSAATVKENYFKVSIGFRLRGDGWFQKMMYH